MRNDLETYLEELREKGLSPEREARLVAEMATANGDHDPPLPRRKEQGPFAGFHRSLYAWDDLALLQYQAWVPSPYVL